MEEDLQLKFSWEAAGRSGDIFRIPSLYEEVLPLPTPLLSFFKRDSLMTPPSPTNLLQTSFTVTSYPLPPPPPPPTHTHTQTKVPWDLKLHFLPSPGNSSVNCSILLNTFKMTEWSMLKNIRTAALTYGPNGQSEVRKKS